MSRAPRCPTRTRAQSLVVTAVASKKPVADSPSSITLSWSRGLTPRAQLASVTLCQFVMKTFSISKSSQLEWSGRASARTGGDKNCNHASFSYSQRGSASFLRQQHHRDATEMPVVALNCCCQLHGQLQHRPHVMWQ